MTISTKRTAILFLFSFISFSGIARKQDSVGVAADIDSTKILTDTVKDGRFKTAGEVWKTVVFGVPGDFVQMGKTVSKDWRVTAAYAGGIALFVLADKPVTQWYQDNVEKNVKYKFPKLANPGNSRFFYGNDAYLNYSIMGLYAGSLIANYKTGQMAALNSTKALVYSYLISQVFLKSIFGRRRPDLTLSDGKPAKLPYTDNPYDFFAIHRLNFTTGPSGTSFPSMHATAYFAVAKVMAMEFNNYWIPYGAVTVLFFADVDAHQHWVGDMVAGGIVGTLIGKGIVLSSRAWEKKQAQRKSIQNRQNKINFNYQVLPVVSGGMTGLTLHMSL
ncbi:phosphatase PAP2 family protein [Mucilaginibacter agri]|uniref:Phosphatase PAP2 family protein n=1 Tax=Mucilaginibacter agri TaxID=2695265 RepID=A0A965ZGG1_9SPHI|nr:phosphatase PAP2 family protein [Mucilaginibacter agri]NCD70545.1 phosphatase PAP2 family protein [Mucilaginibacter agri]